MKKLQEEIRKLKATKGVLILAHYYQRPEVQDIADLVGDSLELSRRAATAPEGTILFCGVTFMAETAKILSPRKTVLMPYPKAGCLLADMAEAREVREMKKNRPSAQVVAYVNTYADVKALADIICTSANAQKVMEKTESDQIIFLPDRNLGTYHSRVVKKQITLWDGYCPVHERITMESIQRGKRDHPKALVIVHPECPPEVTRQADFVGSTSQLVRFVEHSEASTFIVGTDQGVLHEMKKKAPGRIFLLPEPAPLCDQMKMINLERVSEALSDNIYQVEMKETLRAQAEKPIRRMLNL
jgi:quinolinate synthase